jgi:hypothetical protein
MNLLLRARTLFCNAAQGKVFSKLDRGIFHWSFVILDLSFDAAICTALGDDR